MLFRKKMQRACVYCVFGGKIDEDNIICQKCGIVPSQHHCRRFRYDPLKRVPTRPNTQNFEKYKDTDFSL